MWPFFSGVSCDTLDQWPGNVSCLSLSAWQPTFTRIQSGKIKIFFDASHIFRQNIEEYVAAENIHGIHLTFNVTFALCPRRILTVSLYFSSPINVSGADRKGLSLLSPLWDLRCWDRSERGDMNSRSDGIANTDHKTLNRRRGGANIEKWSKM